MDEQGVQERAENAPLWGPSVEDQRGGDVVSYPHHLGVSRQKVRTRFVLSVCVYVQNLINRVKKKKKVQDPVTQGGVKTQGLELNDEFGGY